MKAVESQGSSFANTGGRGGRGGRGNRNNNNNNNSDKKEPYDKKFWADKECKRCHEKGHPAEHCTADKPVSSSDKRRDKDKDEERSSSGKKKSTKERLKEFREEVPKVFFTNQQQGERNRMKTTRICSTSLGQKNLIRVGTAASILVECMLLLLKVKRGLI